MKIPFKRKRAIRFFGWGNKGHKRLGPDVENGTLSWADITLCIATLILVNADKFQWIPDFQYKMEVICLLAILLILASFYKYYHRLCPMSRWRRASWATGMTAAMWAVVPLLVYVTGGSDDLQKMCHYSAWSSIMWIVFLFCLYKLWRVRQQTRAEIAMIEWKSRNRKDRR